MENAPPLDGCQSIFKSGSPTRDAYTKAWIQLINEMEKRKSNLYFEWVSTETTQNDDINKDGKARPTNGWWDDV